MWLERKRCLGQPIELAWLLKHPVGSTTKLKACPHCCTLVEVSKEEYSVPDHLFISNPFDLSCLILIMWFSCNMPNFCCSKTSIFVIESPSSLKRQETKTTCTPRCHDPGILCTGSWQRELQKRNEVTRPFDSDSQAVLMLAGMAALWYVWPIKGGCWDLQGQALMLPADLFISVLPRGADDQEHDGVQLHLQSHQTEEGCLSGWVAVAEPG